MNLSSTFTTAMLCISVSAFCQEPIDITDQTIKIGAAKSEEIYVGFAAGDKIIFNFKEANGKELKEVEVIEYPDNSKFSDFKTDKVEAKTFFAIKQSVYLFRFKNSALSGRICKIHIQRIPASEETKNFNTAVSWVTRQDTSWKSYTKDVIIGYDTVYEQRTKKVLIKTEQKEELLMDKPQRVHSTTNENGSKTSIFFTLPKNITTENKTQKVVAWAYWVGVGEEANKAWKSNVESVKTFVNKTAAYFTSPLGALGIGLVTELITPKLGEDVYYAVTDEQNRNLFLAGQQFRLFDNGKGVAGYRKFSNADMCQGTYFICMNNDNTFIGIDATVKVVAIIEANEYEDKKYTEIIVKPIYEKKLFREPDIKTYRVAVAGL